MIDGNLFFSSAFVIDVVAVTSLIRIYEIVPDDQIIRSQL